MEQFPMFRLAMLLARQVSSPIATRIKDYASAHPRVGRRVVASAGQLHHAAQLRFRLWVLALPQPARVPPLSPAAALESGGNILGECIVFFLGSLIIIFEVNRQANKQEDKELDIQSQWMAVLLQLEELQTELRLQQQDIDRLLAELRRLAARRTPFGSFSPFTPSTPSTPLTPPMPPTPPMSPTPPTASHISPATPASAAPPATPATAAPPTTPATAAPSEPPEPSIASALAECFKPSEPPTSTTPNPSDGDKRINSSPDTPT